MRQDPDVIMVGEVRDTATAEMAVQAALTGHLVFSTLHTNDAPSAVSRLMELGVPPYLINATLLGVLAQRLVRVLCPQCKQPDPDTSSDMLVQAMHPWKFNGQATPYRPVGCEACRMTGFRGRMGLYELLVCSGSLRQQIHQSPAMETPAARPCRTACGLCGCPVYCGWRRGRPRWPKCWQRRRRCIKQSSLNEKA